MSFRAYFILSLLTLTLLGNLAETRAGTITFNSFSLPGFSTGSATVGLPVSPNNDNIATASPNLVTYTIFFNAGGNAPADFEFNVANSGGTTEYYVRSGNPAFNVINNTGTPWGGFRFELGYGTGANFVRSGGSDALDFDTPEKDPAPTSSAFGVLNHQADLIEWSGGAVSLGQVSFALSMDVPDNLQNFNTAGVNRFTLRLTPQPVPEPATMLLLSTGLASIGGTIKRRRQGKE